jgi:hypothetical protein
MLKVTKASNETRKVEMKKRRDEEGVLEGIKKS